MKKTLLFLALVLTSAALWISPVLGVKTAHASLCTDGNAYTASETGSSTVNGTQETVHIALDSNAMICWSGAGVSLDMKYQQVADPSNPGIDVISGNFSDGNTCSQDGAKTDPNFTCTTDTLSAGSYAYAFYLIDLTGVSTQHLTAIRTFTIGNATSTSGLSVSYGGASSPTAHQMNGSTTGGGYDFSVTMNVSGLTAATPITLQLGTASQNGSTSVYTCSAGAGSSGPQTANPSGGSASVTFQLSQIGDGNYCVSAQSSIAGGIAFIPAADPSQVDSNGFFDTPGAIIHVGNAAPLLPGATNNPTANPTGCVTKSDNSNYCLLAPLPGVGDSTGSLDVKGGIGPYFLAIIKVVLGLIGVLSVLMVTIGGIEYMSTVSVGEKEGAKSKITSALFGLLLALTSYIILNTLNPKLINLTVTIPNVGLTLMSTTSNAPYPTTPTAGSGTTTPGGGTSTVKGAQDQYNSQLQQATANAGVDCTFAKAIMSVEDQSGNPNAYSTYTMADGSSGHAYGLMELTPATYAANGGTGNISDPTNNINAGVTYIKNLQNTACNGHPSQGDCDSSNLKYIAAAYNGGPGNNGPSADCPGQTKWECNINRGGLQQTYDYAAQVMTNYNAMKAAGTGC